MAGIPPTGTMGTQGSLLGSTIGLGVSNLQTSIDFYNAVITAIGGSKNRDPGNAVVWIGKAGDTLLLIDKKAATTHGAEIFFSAPSRKAIAKVITALKADPRFNNQNFVQQSTPPLSNKIRTFWVPFKDPDGNTVYVTYSQR